MVGAQVSGAGGVSRAIERAVAIEAEAIQVFVDPNRRFPHAPLPLDELRAFRTLLLHPVVSGPSAKSGRSAARWRRLPAYVHVPYLANLATADSALLERSVDMVARALAAAAHAGLRAVVVHPGSHLGRGFDAVRGAVVAAFVEAWHRGGGAGRLLIENSAGSGGHIGATAAELRSLLDGLDPAGVRAGICVDFAHAHAAGWDLSSERGVQAFVAELRAHRLTARIGLVHANDSRALPASRRDLHANPGSGTIGTRGLRALAGVSAFARVPWILECPGADHSGPRRRDVRRLRAIVDAKLRAG